MPQPYHLAQTYAPSKEFHSLISALHPDPALFCRQAGINSGTYTRMVRLQRVGQQTARLIARYYALKEGRISPRAALALLFVALPRTVMEPVPGTTYFRRRPDPPSTSGESGSACPPRP